MRHPLAGVSGLGSEPELLRRALFVALRIIEKLLISEGTTVDGLRSHEFDFALRVDESGPARRKAWTYRHLICYRKSSMASATLRADS